MSVLGQPTLKRQDIVIGVGVSQEIGFRWGRSDGTLVNLYDYTGRVRMEGLDGSTWATLTPKLYEDGLAVVSIQPGDTSGPEWLSRSTGKWALTVTSPSGKVTCIASGYVTVANMGVR